MPANSDNISVRRDYSEEETLFLKLINDDTELGGMRFCKPITLFDELSSRRVIDLRGATFIRPFSICGSFKGRFLMDYTAFLGGFSAVEATIEGGISAIGARFNRGTSFKHARLMGGCDFSGAHFHQDDRPFEEAEIYGTPPGLNWLQLAPAIVRRRRSC